ncbi:podocalyxin [Lissotriton helveticus]
MRLFLCVSCVLGFAGLSTLKADDTTVSSVPTISPTSPTTPSAIVHTTTAKPTEKTLQPTTGLPTAGQPSSNLPSATSVRQVPSTPVPTRTSSASGPGSHDTPVSRSPVSQPSETSSTSTSTSVSGPLPAPTAKASISLETPAVSKSISDPTILSVSTTAAPMPSQPTHVASFNTNTSKSPGFLVVDQDQSPTVGSSIPGSTTKHITTAALSPAPEGPVLTAGSTVFQETLKPTSKGAVAETTSDGTTTVKGPGLLEKPTGSTETTQSSPVESSTADKTATAATIPVEVPRVTISPSTSQASDSVPSAGPITHTFPGIKLTCFHQDVFNKSLILEAKEQKTILCNNNILTDKTKLLTMLCETAKPGFKFSEDKDNCTVQLGYNKEQPRKFAVLAVSVQTNAAAEDIDIILKGKTEELKKLGFLIDKNSGGEKMPIEEYVDRISIPLIITIVCLASVLLLVAAIYSCCHQRQRHKKDQRLTEELQTMENGYHDNPTLEVMETSPEMQEKKTGLNGDLGDSWIVPLDNLGKEDLDDEEEDTHL